MSWQFDDGRDSETMKRTMEQMATANVKHFFTLYGKHFLTLYGKEIFTS